MIDSSNPHEPPPRHPPLTPRGLLVVVAAIAAFPATLFAIDFPVGAATTLLLIGAITTVISRE